MKRLSIIIGIGVAFLVTTVLLAQLAQSNYTHLLEYEDTGSRYVCLTNIPSFPPTASNYAKGVNDALDTIMLLGLEQELQGTNRSWGAMADIVRKRLRVEKDR